MRSTHLKRDPYLRQASLTAFGISLGGLDAAKPAQIVKEQASALIDTIEGGDSPPRPTAWDAESALPERPSHLVRSALATQRAALLGLADTEPPLTIMCEESEIQAVGNTDTQSCGP